MIIFITESSTSNPSFASGVVSGVILALIGNLLLYYFQGKSKLRDIADSSRAALQYIHMVLCLQRAKLANIPKILEARERVETQGKLNLQQFVFLPLGVSIKEDYLQKILAYPKFNKSAQFPDTFQSIINAVHAFDKCTSFIRAFNEIVSPDKFLAAAHKSQDAYIQIMQNLLGAIKFSYDEAIIINEKARERTKIIGNEVFGKKFILPKVEDEVIEAQNI